jgi:hypothetical protein
MLAPIGKISLTTTLIASDGPLLTRMIAYVAMLPWHTKDGPDFVTARSALATVVVIVAVAEFTIIPVDGSTINAVFEIDPGPIKLALSVTGIVMVILAPGAKVNGKVKLGAGVVDVTDGIWPDASETPVGKLSFTSTVTGIEVTLVTVIEYVKFDPGVTIVGDAFFVILIILVTIVLLSNAPVSLAATVALFVIAGIIPTVFDGA